jgi:sugar phosphate isomerase/epimerase
MKKQRLGFSIGKIEGVSAKEQISLLKDVGFDAIATRYDEYVAEYREEADKRGLEYPFVHLTNRFTQFLWTKGEGAEEMIGEWTRQINACANAGVSLVVLHPFRGIDMLGMPAEHGVENFKHVADAAARRNVRIAIENCEGEEYLATLLDAFADAAHIGFCWDTGHEQCYNRGLDMMARFGHRLFCTHLNDNLGVRSGNGTITSKDDLHYLPYDGVSDWKSVRARLAAVDCRDVFTLEVNKSQRYADMTTEAFFAEAYARACRIVKE